MHRHRFPPKSRMRSLLPRHSRPLISKRTSMECLRHESYPRETFNKTRNLTKLTPLWLPLTLKIFTTDCIRRRISTSKGKDSSTIREKRKSLKSVLFSLIPSQLEPLKMFPNLRSSMKITNMLSLHVLWMSFSLTNPLTFKRNVSMRKKLCKRKSASIKQCLSQKSSEMRHYRICCQDPQSCNINLNLKRPCLPIFRTIFKKS